MQVILDSSPLGLGFYHRQAQTGISRVVEHLVTGLWQSPDVSLRLAATTHLAETMRYAQDAFGKAAPLFVNRPVEQRRARLENALLRPFGVVSLPSKVIREGFYRGRKAVHADEARLDPSLFGSRAIYHSLFSAIPATVARAQSVRKVLTIHDLIPIHHPEWFPEGEQVVKQAMAALPPDANVVTVSEATKADFCAYTNVDPARVTPIHLAASRTLFYPVADETRRQAIRQRFQLGDSPYLLSLATLEPRKNIDHLIRCFVRLVENRELPSEIKLVLVGIKGWKIDALIKEVAQNERVRSQLVFTGFVPDEDLAPLYSGALAFVYPSLYEGFGLPPLEAMQCGLPVITSNVSSLPEVVGNAAIQVSPMDADALCQVLINVVNSEALRTDLSEKSLQRAKLFSWEKFVQAHIDLYRRL